MVLLLTLTLRAPATAVAPLVSWIGEDTGLGAAGLALLTSLPLACFILVAPAVPVLSRRVGTSRLVAASLVIATLGAALRGMPGLPWLIAGTVVMGAGLAAAGVLAPAVVRSASPRAGRMMTAVYTAGLSLGPAMATGLSIPAADLLGGTWRTALALWGVLPLLTLAVWPLFPGDRPVGGTAAEVGHEPRTATERVLASPDAWRLTGYLGSSSLLFYTVAAWLPAILQDAGRDPSSAGRTAALVGLVAVPAALVSPLLAVGRHRTRWVATLAPVPLLVGLLLLAVTPGAAGGWAIVLIGVGQGASVAMSYTLVVRSARSAQQATALSSMSQTIGVTLAAVGPLALGASLDLSGSWGPGLIAGAGIAFAQALLGHRVTRAPH